jgi:hypothetical protein
MRRAGIISAIYLAGAFALFVFMHTGSRAAAACGAEGSYRTGTVSFWPPGTECAGPAPPASTVIVFNVAWCAAMILATIPLAAIALIVAGRIKSRARGVSV